MTSDATADRSGCLYLVSTPIGNLGDITRRAVEVLADVDLVIAEDTRRTRALLTHLGLRAPLESHHEHNESRRLAGLVGRLTGGADIALVSDAGTPLLSDPGYPLVRAAVATGIRVVPVPGASAPLAALVASGLPSDRFTFVGYPPRRPAALKRFFEELVDAPGTLVFLESPRRLARTLVTAARALGADRPAAVARELTKAHEEFLRGSLGELAAAIDGPPRGEVTVCVGRGVTRDDAAEPPDDATLARDYEALVAGGAAPGDAVREVARIHGMRRRETYRRLHLQPRPPAAGDSEA